MAKIDIQFPRDFYLDDVGVWRLKKEKLAELEHTKPLTNEEWLRSCSTEQLAHVLNKMTLHCYICGQDGPREDSRHCVFGGCTGEADILEWLKKPHNSPK